MEGGAGNDTLIGGTGGNNGLYGGAGNDSLRSFTGFDVLDGGDGVDTMQGGNLDDRYIVTAGDVLIEEAGGGTDTVESSVSWALGANFENLTLTGTAAATVTGNNLDNILDGNDANNASINGRAGNDTMFGRGGNDTFDMSTGGTSTYGTDYIDGGTGSDTVDFGANARSAVTANLATRTMSGGGDAGSGSATLIDVENVIGGAFNDSLTGNASANFFYGGAGNDTLAGGAGADRLQGAAGNDSFVFAASGGANADLVLDFASGADKLALDDAFFTAIGAAGNFSAGDARFFAAAGATAGHDANDRVIYNTTTGNLYYDADGSGSGAAQLVATIQGHPAVAATDIAVI
jgi:Ca2+-binding RTX toxin-like protein